MLSEATGPVLAYDPRTLRCPTCVGPADVHSRHLLIDGSSVRVFCSEGCLERAVAGEPEPEPEPPPGVTFRPPSPFIVGGFLVGCLFVSDTVDAVPPPAPRPVVAFLPPPPIIFVAPKPPPPTPEELVEAQWTSELIRDVWLHPLSGPVRRMPIRDSRVFGAERPGDRPIECANGHCGVDIGGEVWGEQVLAAHDGVVDRVQRGPNEERGGLYVRLSHRGGTVFTQYFHLAAIPRWIEAGREVHAGDVVGLLGDSGVKSSGPHLHFALSIKPAHDQPERYIDPEPLIALWPVRLPEPGGAKLSAAGVPGAVIGASGHRRRPRPAAAAATAGVTEPTEGVEDDKPEVE